MEASPALTEIRWHGRGGQGAVTAAKMVAELALGEGKYFQAFPEYGPERSGAPIVAFTRVSDEPIQVYSGIEHPQIVVVLDSSLLKIVDVTKGAPDDAVVLVNSERSPAQLRKDSGLEGNRLFTIAATRIAVETIKRPIPNTPMVGALTRITGLFDIDDVVDVPARGLRQEVPAQGRRGQHRRHHAQLRGGPGRMTVDKKAGAKKPAPLKKPAARKAPAKKKPTWDISDVDQWGPERHELGATIVEAGNSVYNETGGWRSLVPEIDVEKCDGCMLCYFYCPDASIIVEDNRATGVDLEHCKGCGICAKECPTKAIVMQIDKKE